MSLYVESNIEFDFTAAPTRFVLLFEPPHPLDAALLGSRITRVQGQIQSRYWAQPVTVSILTVGEWNRRMRMA